MNVGRDNITRDTGQVHHPPPKPMGSGTALTPKLHHLSSPLLLQPKHSSSLLLLRRSLPRTGAGGRTYGRPMRLTVVGYMERKPNSITGLARKVIGSLPVVGLIARLFSDEGGVGGDLVDFAEFRRRVGNKCSITDSQAFYEFRDRRGRAGDPLYVLLCCWLTAIGAGLLKSEEILEGAARLRISNDIEFEEETFFAMMTAAKERRAKLKAAVPEIPMEIRVEKALEAIYVCCFSKDPIADEDARLLCVMLCAVFPSVGESDIVKIISSTRKQIATGEKTNFPEPKTLSKEAIERQMKDLEFLKQNKDA